MTEDNLQNVHPLVPGVDARVLGARLHLLEPVFSFCELQPTATATSCQRFSLILGALQAHLEGCFFAPFLGIDFADQASQLLPNLLGRVKYQPTEECLWPARATAKCLWAISKVELHLQMENSCHH